MLPLFTLDELIAAYQLGVALGLGTDGVPATDAERNRIALMGGEFRRKGLAGEYIDGFSSDE